MKMKCPCNPLKSFSFCCEKFLKNAANPQSPEELMRSRYSAYALGNMDYIQQTMLSPAADNFNLEEAIESTKKTRFTRLKVMKTWFENENGFVEFKAKYFVEKKCFVLHEKSEFHKVDGKWFYVDGES